LSPKNEPCFVFVVNKVDFYVQSMKQGILLVNLGTPDDPSRYAVYRYLREFLTDGRVIDVPWVLRQVLVQGIIAPFRSKQSSDAYKKLWTERGSPLKFYGYDLMDMVQERLGDGFQVELAMRYQSPSIESSIEKLIKANVTQLIVVPLFPQYASASTGSVQEEVMRCLSKYLTIPPITIVQSFHDLPGMIEVFAAHAREMHFENYDYYLFSYHGLPQRHLRNSDLSGKHCLKVADCCNVSCPENKSCYSAQCHRTTEAIAKSLGLPKNKYSVSFQSRLGRDPWAKPYTPVEIKRLNDEGYKKVLVFSPAFVADCLETTIEIGEEYHEEFIEMGGEKLDYVPSLNDDPRWADALTEMILSKV
jgi:protoporphyrin/coproporphyrin ferrochelatase